jgi:DNA-directed RNA polymerase subunit RPC12/RpoP
MKIEAKCNTCGRTFVFSQIGPESDAPGRCPFCGTHFARHYTGLLIESVSEAELAAQRFAEALGRLEGMETGFDIDIEGVISRLAERVRTYERRQAG